MTTLLLALISALPAFPTCQGFGCQSVGGSGRHLKPPATTVMKVTTLADSGAGSLRACLEASGPRTCVFEVSGIIKAENWLKVLNPYITVAGETSPGGVTVRGWNVQIVTHDVVIRHLRLRSGDDPDGAPPGNRRPIGIYGDGPVPGAWNIVLDHLSLSWAIDQNADTWFQGLHDITLSNSILSEPLYDSIHPMGPQGTAILVGEDTTRLSLVRNLFAHNFSRNPYFKAGASSELVNNVVYHWGFGKGGATGEWAMVDLSDYDHNGKVSFHNFVGNTFKCGADSECGYPPIFSSTGVDALNPASKVYVKGNVGPGRPNGTGDEWAITNGLQKPLTCTSAPAVPGSKVRAISAQEAFTAVLRDAGAFPRERDAVDARIVAETKAGTGNFINCVADDGSERCSKNAGGWPVIPERRRELVLPANPNGLRGDGYTNLEHWLRRYPSPMARPTPSPTPTPHPTYPPCL